jgi:hypothetical protein
MAHNVHTTALGLSVRLELEDRTTTDLPKRSGALCLPPRI